MIFVTILSFLIFTFITTSEAATPCNNHAACKHLNQTSCLPDYREPHKKYCLCGDNKVPDNGRCKAVHKGADHLCNNDCVEDATCTIVNAGTERICKCNEGFFPTRHGYCSDAVSARRMTLHSLLLLFIIIISN